MDKDTEKQVNKYVAQVAYKLRHLASGLCERCPKPQSKRSRRFCETHRIIYNAYLKTYRHHPKT